MPCIPLFEDNEGAIQIAKHPISNSNSKHIDVPHHFLREFVERKEIEIIPVAAQYQHADFLTKALPEREFEFHNGIVMSLMGFPTRIIFDFLIFQFFVCFFGLCSDLYLFERSEFLIDTSQKKSLRVSCVHVCTRVRLILVVVWGRPSALCV